MGPPRRRRYRILGWSLAGLLAAVLSVVLVARTEWAARRLADVLATVIETQTGERAVIGAVWVYPEAARVRVEGLVVTHRSDDPDNDGQPVAAVDWADVSLRLDGWRPAIGDVTLMRPVVRLHIDEGGLRELPGLTQGSSQMGESFPWGRLRVRGGDVRVSGAAWTVSLVGLRGRSSGAGPTTVRIADVELRAGELSLHTEGLLLDDLVVTPAVLRLPTTEINFDGVDVVGDAAVRWGGPVQANFGVKADLSVLNPLVGPDASLLGTLHADVGVEGTTDDPWIGGAISSDDLVVVSGPAEAPRQRAPGPLRGGWRVEGARVVLEALQVGWERGALAVDGSIDLTTLGVYLVVSAEGLSLAEGLRRGGVSDHPWVDLELDLEAHVAGRLNPLALAGTADLAIINVDVRGGPIDDPSEGSILRLPVARLVADLEIDPDVVRINARRLATRRSHGSVDARILFGPETTLDILVNLPRVALDELRPLGGLDLGGTAAVTARLTGPGRALGIAGTIDGRDVSIAGVPIADRLRTPVRVVDMRHLRFEGFDGAWRAVDYGGQLDVDFRAEGMPLDLQLLLHRGRVNDLVGMFLDVPGLDAEVEGSLSLQGPWDRLTGDVLLDLRDADVFGERFSNGGATAWMQDGRLTVQELWLDRGNGEASILARGSVGAGYALDMEVLTGGLELENLALIGTGRPRLRGRLVLDSRILGTLLAPEPHGRLTLRGASVGPRAIGESTLYFDSSDEVLAFYGTLAGSELDVEGTVGLDPQGAWTVKAGLDGFPAHLFYPEAVDGSPVSALVTGALTASGALGDGDIPLIVDAKTDAVSLSWDRHQLESTGPWTWTVRGPRFDLKGVELVGGDTSIAFGGRRTVDGRLLLSGGGTVDMDLLRMVVPSLNRAEGVAQVEVSVGGQAGALSPELRVQIQDALIAGDWFPQPLEGIEATIGGTAEGYKISRARGRLGGGTWEGRGTIAAESWLPTRFDLAASVDDARIRYVDYLPAIVGDAELTFDGPVDSLLLGGRVRVREMLFAERIDWEEAILAFSSEHLVGAAAEQGTDWFDLNLEMTADRSVRVRNNLADLVASGQLRFIGDTARPGLIGEIRAESGGRVYLKEREFELVRGELRFIDPYSFDPELDIALSTRVRTRDEEYLIDYRVGGPYSDWRTQTSSNPSLPQADINALLLFGMTREELQRYGGAAAALALEGGDLLARKFGVTDTIGEGITSLEFTRFLRPDRFDLVSGASERGSGAISSDFRLIAEKDLDWSTVIFEQNISRISDSYVALERRLADRLYARTYWARQQLGRSLDIGGAYGLEFNVRWELD
jgi:autotransporter translocation and assembly factor TamB